MLWEFFFQFLVEDEAYGRAQHFVRKVLDESRSIDAEGAVVYGRKECLRHRVHFFELCRPRVVKLIGRLFLFTLFYL